MKTIRITYRNKDIIKTVGKAWNKFEALKQLRCDPAFVRVEEV